MSSFEERESAFEAKFAHDADMQFRAEARRNKLLGLWAADLMGLSQADSFEYAVTVVKADLQESGDGDVFDKLAEDLADKASPEAIRATMATLMTMAKAQLLEEV